MSVTAETYLPDDDQQTAKVYDFLAAHQAAEPRYYLSGVSPEDRVELPEGLYRMLRLVVQALRNGVGVEITPLTRTLTTQQAAELLNVSRPTVVKLLDEGAMPYAKIGTHRRIQLGDLLAYRAQRHAGQYAALDEIAADYADDEDLDTILDRTRAARKDVARRLRGISNG